jgi:hypothetical protein
MKHRLFFALQGVLLAMMGFSTVPAVAQTTAPSFYYPPSAWDLKMQCNTKATCPRFVVLSNWIDTDHPSGGAAVLDRETGLVWEQSPTTSSFSWFHAQLQCNGLTVGSRLGWRLPTLQELASLVDPTQDNPALPAGHPFSNVQSSSYWSATTFAAVAGVAWVVNFGSGLFVSFGGEAGSNFVWCVRGGQGVNPQ